MAKEALENLVKIKSLKVEPCNRDEVGAMIESGKNKLKDAALQGLSKDSCFLLAYGAAHAFSLAALRLEGYRSEHRYMVFQCLEHTLDFPSAKWRVLDTCHRKRNLAEYEGELEIEDSLLEALLSLTKELQEAVDEKYVLFKKY